MHFMTETFKFNPRTSPGFTLSAVPKDVKLFVRNQLKFNVATGHQDFYEKIMTHASYFADNCNFENNQLRHTALEFVKLYLHTFNRNSSFRIEPSTYHYHGEAQFRSLKVTAMKNVPTGNGIPELLMFTKYVKDMPRRWESYSVHCHYVAVGPLMYANHSWLNNAEYVSHSTLDQRLRFVWASSLFVEESNEITVNYGPEYFECMRCECEKCRPKPFTFAWFRRGFGF